MSWTPHTGELWPGEAACAQSGTVIIDLERHVDKSECLVHNTASSGLVPLHLSCPSCRNHYHQLHYYYIPCVVMIGVPHGTGNSKLAPVHLPLS